MSHELVTESRTHRLGDMESEGHVTVALSEWELANLHLPPVTTVTFYSGTAPLQYLRRRIALILAQNPWLTSRLVKRSTTDGVVAMTYDEASAETPPVDEHLAAYDPMRSVCRSTWTTTLSSSAFARSSARARSRRLTRTRHSSRLRSFP